MHVNRDSTSVIFYCTGTVLLKNYMDPAAVSCKMLIHRIIHNLVYQMVQSLSGHASDIHTGTFTYGLKAFQDRDTARIISVFLCHSTDSFLFLFRTFVCIISKIFIIFNCFFIATAYLFYQKSLETASKNRKHCSFREC